MEFRIYKHRDCREFYVVRGDKEHYLYFNTRDSIWRVGNSDTWEKIAWPLRETSWLELLITTGTTQKQAEELWHEHFGEQTPSKEYLGTQSL